MHGLELKALAAMDGHQPDRIHVKGGGRHLAQIALFCEQHKLADAIEGALNSEVRTDRTVIAQEIQELPDRNVAHPAERNRAVPYRGQVGAIKKIRREKIPSRDRRRQSLEICARNALARRLPAKDRALGARFDSEVKRAAWTLVAGKLRHTRPARKGRSVAWLRPRQPAPEGVDGETKQRKQIAYFVAFEQAAEVKNGYATRFKRRGDLI